MAEEYITRRELMEMLKISKTTLYHLRKKDETFPKAILVARHTTRFKKKEILDWLDSRRVDDF